MLLKTMELDEEEALEEDIEANPDPISHEDDDTCQLPEEWKFNITEERKRNEKADLIDAAMEVEFDLSSNGEEGNSDQTAHSSLILGGGESNNTQPTREVLEKQVLKEGLQKGKKGSKKSQWGPFLPVRSSRNIDNGKLMMEKAQEAKRKWNLDEKTGNLTKNSKISKTLLISVAKDIGLDVMDGNPDIVEAMIELDCSRIAASELNCTIPNCKSSHSLGNENVSDIASSSRNFQSPIKNCHDGNQDNQDTN